MRIPLAKEGLPLVGGLLGVSIVLGVVGLWVLSALAVVLACLVAAFFRDPVRDVSVVDGQLLSPADGKVLSIKRMGGQSDRTLVAIFMSLLDCHVNRSPVTGRVENVVHKPGKFLPAYKQAASSVNEQNKIRLIDSWGEAVGVTQIAGVIARRIVCHLRAGDVVKAGERIGLIKFGSRVEVEVPSSYRICVTVGQRVRAGVDVVGERNSS